jgi:hypothetical protein
MLETHESSLKHAADRGPGSGSLEQQSSTRSLQMKIDKPEILSEILALMRLDMREECNEGETHPSKMSLLHQMSASTSSLANPTRRRKSSRRTNPGLLMKLLLKWPSPLCSKRLIGSLSNSLRTSQPLDSSSATLTPHLLSLIQNAIPSFKAKPSTSTMSCPPVEGSQDCKGNHKLREALRLARGNPKFY